MKPEPKTAEDWLARAAEHETTALQIKFHDPHGYKGMMRMANSYLDRAIELEAADTTA